MNSSTSTAVDRELQVGASGRCFPEERWREGILYFLFGVWSGNTAVTMRPKISFGGVTLRLAPDPHALNPDIRAYYAYGVGTDNGMRLPVTKWEERLNVRNEQEHVETALIRFVKDDRIRTLFIGMCFGGGIQLWKTSRRGEYRCASINLPKTWEGVGRAHSS